VLGSNNWQQLLLPVAVVSAILVILLPLPAMAIDLLLIANIALSVIILLTTIQVKTPMEFSVFPALLLTTTLGRLVLNVATTRRILTSGHEGIESAGGVIQGFGQFVSADSLVVGAIIFSIIVLIQFIVITKGSGRISEVAARFMLDSLPGRQMAIDAELNAGTIDEQEAATKRSELSAQSDFFGAMDGAGKFVRGDAIAAIIITAINILGGLVIGMTHGMSASEAAGVFTKLTIGDGLASQIPAFLIAISAGLLVTRSNRESNLSLDFLAQLFMRPQVLAVAGVFIAALVITRLPAIPVLGIGGCCIALAMNLNRKNKKIERQPEPVDEPVSTPAPTVRIEDYLAIDPLEVEMGIDLIPLADPSAGGDLLSRINRVRQTVATELGIILPKVRIRDNLNLEPDRYRIRIFNNPIAEGNLQTTSVLAIEDAANSISQLDGELTFEPASGRPAKWIRPEQESKARESGCFLQIPAAILANHLASVARRNADLILTRDATQHLINEVQKTSPTVVDELIPEVFRVAEIQQVLQALLREGVSIRQLGIILETLGNHARSKSNTLLLVEFVRQRLAANLCAKYSNNRSQLDVMTISQILTEQISHKSSWHGNEVTSTIPQLEIDLIVEQLVFEYEKIVDQGTIPIVLVDPSIRPVIRMWISDRLPGAVVMSTEELTNDFVVNQIAEVEVAEMSFSDAG